MTTDTGAVSQLSDPIPLRPRIGNQLMRFATRINWAESELRGLAAVVRQGDTVFDIGAAHGMYTIPLAHLVGPSGNVQSFEPHPRQQRQLRFLRKLLGMKQVTVNNAAAGSHEGDFTMRLPLKFGFPIYGHAHIADDAAHPMPPAAKIREWRTPVHTIDGWVQANSLTDVTFMKVDVEGFEPNVVAGAAQTIELSHPSMLLEIEDRHLARYGTTANEFADNIRSRWPEYGMYTWVDDAWAPTQHVTLDARNYLFATDLAFARP